MGRRQADFAVFASDCVCGPVSAACGDSNCMDPILQEKIDTVTEVGDQLAETYRDSLSLAEMADRLKRCEERLDELEDRVNKRKSESVGAVESWKGEARMAVISMMTALSITGVLFIVACVIVIAFSL